MIVKELITWLEKFDPYATIDGVRYVYMIAIIENEGTYNETMTIPYKEAIEKL